MSRGAQEKKRFVSFGCSFTSGHEIIDHEFLNTTFDDCNFRKQKIGSRVKFDLYLEKETGKPIKELVKLSSKRSYAGKLAGLLNLEYKTYALHGHALEHSVLLFLQALHNRELNPDTDLLFFGLTTPQRYLHFGLDGEASTRVINNNFTEVDLFYNSYKIMQTYGFALNQIITTCKELNFDFILQPVISKDLLGYVVNKNNYYCDMIESWEFMPIFDEILEKSLEYSIDPNSYLHKFNDLKRYKQCFFLHPCEDVHELFARDLYDRYKFKKKLKKLKELDPFIYD